MEIQTSAPWKCKPCKRLCKATAQHCPSCGKVWSKCYDKSYIHNAKPDNSWSWPSAREASPRSRTARQRSSSARSKKGKGKGKLAKGEGGIPSNYILPLPPAAPWMPESGTLDTTTSSAQAALDSELLAAIKRSYPDASQMPSEIKLMVEKKVSECGEQTNYERPSLGYYPVGKGQKMYGRADRISGSSSQSLDELSQGVCQLTDLSAGEVQRAGEAVCRADGKSKGRNAECEKHHPSTQCTIWNSNAIRASDAFSRDCGRRVARVTATDGEDPASEHRSVDEAQDGEDRAHRLIYGRRRGRRGGQPFKVENAQSFFVKKGSVPSCHKRPARQPPRVSFEVVEAYDARIDRAASYSQGLSAAECRNHSVMFETDYVDPLQALVQANKLAGALVLDSMSQDIIGFFCTLVEIGCHFLQPDRTSFSDPILEVQDDPVHAPTQEVLDLGHAATFCQLSASGTAVLSEGSGHDFEEEIELVTYGLLRTNLGKRSGSCSPTPYAIMEEATRVMWEDFQRMADYAIIHLVKPQFDAPWKIIAIVELLSSLSRPTT